MPATATDSDWRRKSNHKDTAPDVEPNPHHSEVEENLIAGYGHGALAEFLTKRGLPQPPT
jgi:hypothetical protein